MATAHPVAPTAGSCCSPSEQAAPRGRRLTVNITPAERVGRVLLGAAAAIVGIVLLTSASSTLAIVLDVLLVAAGLDLVVTGALGHCPLYKRLGYTPASLRHPT